MASDFDFEKVMSHAEQILEKFSKAKDDIKGKGSSEQGDQRSSELETPMSPPKEKPKRKRGGSHSTNWKIVGDLLNEEQRTQLADFYREKAPQKQNDQVAVLTFKLQELLGREAFDGHEIHTAYQVVGTKTPANLNGVFGNMSGEGLGSLVEKKWTPTFKSSDLVKHDLPPKSKEK